jgi:hypothetical protein
LDLVEVVAGFVEAATAGPVVFDATDAAVVEGAGQAPGALVVGALVLMALWEDARVV